MNISNLLLQLHPTAKFHLGSNDYAELIWDDSNPPRPTLAELQALEDANNLALWRETAALTRKDFKHRLVEFGLFDTVDNAMKALPSSHLLRIDYEDSAEMHRNNPGLVGYCKTVLAMTDLQIDSFFS